MKKRLGMVLCLLAAALILLLPWSLAAPAYEDVYLVGINDTVMLGLINASQMPVRRSGTIYAPYTLLDNKDLDLSYALNRTNGTFTVFDRRQTVIFQLNGSGAEDKDGNSYNDHVISRDGVVFIPLRFVAAQFGLTYSFYNLVLPEGTVPIARVRTARAALSDQQFGASAASLVAGPLRQYAESQATPTPAAPSDGGWAAPSGEPSAAPKPVDVGIAISCTDGGGFAAMLDALAAGRYSALFLFSPEDLAARDSDVRAAAAAGHQIGLLLPREEPEAAFRRGNELLGHILRAETVQVAFLEGGAQEGPWQVWSGNVFPRGGAAAAQAGNLSQDVDAQTTARVTLTDSRTCAQALQRTLRSWRQRPYTLFTPTETS